jgi:WD40 repeat protein
VRIREVAARTGRTAGVFAVPRLDSPGVLSNGQIIDAYVDGTVLRVRIIDRRTGRSRALQPGPAGDGNYAVTPAATPDGRLIAVGDNGYRIDVWNARSGRLIRSTLLPEAAASGASAVPAPNGRFVLVNVLGGAYVRIDLGTGRSEELPGQGVEGTALAISPDSRYYAIGHADGTINLYNAQTLRVVRVHKLNSSVLNVVFSPNSRELAAEDTNHVLEVWDTCAICENPHALARAASKASIRTLTTGERATFGVTK